MSIHSRMLCLLGAFVALGSPAGAADEDLLLETRVAMRDGVKLKTTVFTQLDRDPRPVVLLRTPYGQAGFKSQAERFVEAGYVAVTQDCRGRHGSEGDFVFYWGEGPDGFDTIEWIRMQPWCNGKVGMWGPSYMGSDQWLAAAEGAKIDALAPTASAPNFYYNVYLDGAYLLPHAKTGFCIDLFGPPTDIGSSPRWPEWYMHLPLTEWDQVIGRDVPWQMAMIRHYRPDGFWKRADASDDFARMDFPAQHIVGYYDFMCRQSVLAFERMCREAASAFARDNQQLILGPWDHGTGRAQVAEVDFGPQATLDVLTENIQWFDRFLRGQAAAEAGFPRVRYFTMGENKWHETSDWPPPEGQETPFYLRSSGHARTRHGDGRLETAAPDPQEETDSFRSDPNDPVPAWPAKGQQYQDVWGPVDQSLAMERDDVLVYQTPILEQPLRFAGNPRLELWVAADVPDADWVAKLIDIGPDGKCIPLASGVRRGSARDSEIDRTPLEPGKHYALTVNLGPCSAAILPMHRLAVMMAGSNFPNYDRNTHTGEGPTARTAIDAVEQVFHHRDEPSRLILPVVHD